LNLTIFADTGSPMIGQTYVSARLIRGLSAATILLGGLLGGYITAKQPLTYPGSVVQNSFDVLPVPREYLGTAPAAGAEISETVPTGARWEVVSCRVPLVTAAGGADRIVRLFLSRVGVITFAVTTPPAAQPPSTTYIHMFGSNLPHQASTAAAAIQSSFPNPAHLLAGAAVLTQTLNLAAGDQFSQPALMIREWLEVA